MNKMILIASLALNFTACAHSGGGSNSSAKQVGKEDHHSDQCPQNILGSYEYGNGKDAMFLSVDEVGGVLQLTVGDESEPQSAVTVQVDGNPHKNPLNQATDTAVCSGGQIITDEKDTRGVIHRDVLTVVNSDNLKVTGKDDYGQDMEMDFVRMTMATPLAPVGASGN